jgi:hypothetical protein
MPEHFAGVPQHSSWKFSMGLSFVELLILGFMLAGVAWAVASRGKHRANGSPRRTWWPVLLLIPLLLVPLLFVGMFTARSSVHHTPPPPAEIHAFQHDFGSHVSFESHRQAIDRARKEAQQRLAEAQTEVLRAQQQVAGQARANLTQIAHAKRTAECALDEAVSAPLRMLYGTMDLDALIELREAPKIDLSSEPAEAPLPPAPPQPVVAAPRSARSMTAVAVVNESDAEKSDEGGKLPDVTQQEDATNTGDVAAKVAVVAAEVENNEADVSKTASTPVEAEPGDVPPELSEPPASIATPAPKPKPLPEWVDDEPGPEAPNSWREVIVTDEYATTEECRQATDILLLLKTADRARSLGDVPFFEADRPSLTFDRGMVRLDDTIIFDKRNRRYWRDDRLQMLQEMGIGIDDVRRSIILDQHMASRESPRSMGTMYKQYTLVEFTPEFSNELRRASNNYLRKERFEMVGAGAGSVLGLLGLVFGLLKIDTWTKGYYSKRLFIGVPAAIIGGFGLLAFFASIN